MSSPVTAASYMRKAERALDEARVLLREAKTEGACSRAYYAMHDAAHAALFATGNEAPEAIIKTHHQLIGEFGRTRAGRLYRCRPRTRDPKGPGSASPRRLRLCVTLPP